jgi:hypothetical protein
LGFEHRQIVVQGHHGARAFSQLAAARDFPARLILPINEHRF